MQEQPTPSTQSPAPQPDWRELRRQERMQRRARHHAAGVPFWGILLILIGLAALFGNLGIGIGWIFGLAIGAWFVYLGARDASSGGDIHWWLVGLGLLIGLGSLADAAQIANAPVFAIVLIIVGIGVLGQQVLSQQNRE